MVAYRIKFEKINLLRNLLTTIFNRKLALLYRQNEVNTPEKTGSFTYYFSGDDILYL